jgi:hypothetical protein
MEFLFVGTLCCVGLTLLVWSRSTETEVRPNDQRLSALEIAITGAVVVAVFLLGPAFPLRGSELYGGIVSPIRPPAAADGVSGPAAFFAYWGATLIGCFYFAMMVLGMLGEYMFRLKKWSSFRLEEFVRPLWVALIVFGIPWSTVDKSVVTLSSVITCYQNGFFWKLVLDRQRKERGQK